MSAATSSRSDAGAPASWTSRARSRSGRAAPGSTAYARPTTSAAVGHLHEGVTDGHGHADERLRRRPVGWRDGDLGEQHVSHLDQQLLLVRDVPVEGAGRDPELAGQTTHREVCETVAAQQVDGGRDDLLTAECHALPRLRRTAPVDPR